MRSSFEWEFKVSRRSTLLLKVSAQVLGRPFDSLRGETSVDQRDEEGRTALYYAAYSGYDRIVTILLEAKAEVNKEDKRGWTALHRAAHSGHDTIVKILLEANAEVEKQTIIGLTALALALAKYQGYIEPREKYGRVVELLLKAKVDSAQLNNAIQ